MKNPNEHAPAMSVAEAQKCKSGPPEMQRHDTAIAGAANALAAAGWRIIPLHAGTKLPQWAGWTDRAAADTSPWIADPAANVGIACGAGFFVVDVDVTKGKAGPESLDALQAAFGDLPPTLTARTASGGLHLYFTSAQPVRNSAGKLGHGIDVRGMGGQVVAPGSIVDGKAYTWESLAPMAAAPEWLESLAMDAAPVRERAAGAPEAVEATPELLADLADALQAIPADGRDEWVSVGAALRALGDDGRALWVSWSAGSDKHNPDTDPDQWETIGHDSTGPAAIFARAQRLGWQNLASLRRAAKVFGHERPVIDGEPIEPAADLCSEVANAHRIVTAWGGRLLFVYGAGWHTWNGARWEADDLGARRLVQGLGRIVKAEADVLRQQVKIASEGGAGNYVALDKAERSRTKWAATSSQKKCRDASLALASELIHCTAGDLDAGADLIGTPDGVLDLRTGTTRPGASTDRITKSLGCAFDPAANAPTWQRFMVDITGGDAELSGYLQRLAGYALSGRPDAHVLPILYGSGSNGKSTWLTTLQAAMGDYAGTAAPGLLVTSAERQHASATADLPGKRLVVASESGEYGRLNEDMVKMLTGGDRIAARRLYQAAFEFSPTHVLMLQTNHRPRVSGTDTGIWRRLQLVPFTVTIAPERRDPKLPEKLRAELPGVLAWIYAGLVAYRAEGLRPPAAVTDASTEYRESSDVVGAWLADCCRIEAGATASASDLYASYRMWCTSNGERERTQRDLGLRLAERGLDKYRVAAGIRWQGVALINTFGGKLTAVQ